MASQAVHDYWRKRIIPEFSQLSLAEKEAVSISPYSRKLRTKRQAAESLTELDFVVMDRKLKRRKLLFHIELQSGPGAIDEMHEFQLDINDSNDIIGVANNTRLPVYIFHVQTEFRYDPPTRASVARKIWWTDIFKLLKHRISVRTRRGEDKKAGYYSSGLSKRWTRFQRNSEETSTGSYRSCYVGVD